VLGKDLGAGFALAGVDVEVVMDPDSAREAVLAAAGRKECGILIVEEELFARVPDGERESLLQRTVPLIVLLPGDMLWGEVEEIKADEYVAALIRRAVGYQLNIRL
jgi:vacuolar-type H+-ATPase subunit F/Vma7